MRQETGKEATGQQKGAGVTGMRRRREENQQK